MPAQSPGTCAEPPTDSLDVTRTYLKTAQVRRRYGDISDMTIWRWLKDEELGFPRPLRIKRERFWKLSELTGWEQRRRHHNDDSGSAASLADASAFHQSPVESVVSLADPRSHHELQQRKEKPP
jgi:predicted DNA-binding transcriptional regulator AlpA